MTRMTCDFSICNMLVCMCVHVFYHLLLLHKLRQYIDIRLLFWFHQQAWGIKWILWWWPWQWQGEWCGNLKFLFDFFVKILVYKFIIQPIFDLPLFSCTKVYLDFFYMFAGCRHCMCLKPGHEIFILFKIVLCFTKQYIQTFFFILYHVLKYCLTWLFDALYSVKIYMHAY